VQGKEQVSEGLWELRILRFEGIPDSDDDDATANTTKAGGRRWLSPRIRGRGKGAETDGSMVRIGKSKAKITPY
jgi:hypothetical protein